MSEKLKRACTKQARHRPHPHFLSRSTLNRLLCLAGGVELVAALTLSLSKPAFAADSVQINDLVIAAPMPDAQREATVKAVRAFYDFWNTGDEALLKTSHRLQLHRSHAAAGPTARTGRTRLCL